MSAYLFLPLVQTASALILIGIVLKGHIRSGVHRLFACLLLTMAAWGLVIFAMRASPDLERAYFWERGIIPVGALMSLMFYHFSVQYTLQKRKKWVLNTLYLICSVFMLLTATDLIVSGMWMRPYGYAPVFGPLALLWMVFNYWLVVMALINFLRAWRTSFSMEQRNRAAYIALGMVLMIVGSLFDILPAIGLPLYPGVIIGNIAFAVITATAIVRHNLLDIHVFVRKTAAYLLTSALFAAPFVFAFLLSTGRILDRNVSSWLFIPIFLLLSFGLPQLWQLTQRQVDRWFFRERYDYLKALDKFSWHTQRLSDTRELSSNLVNLLVGALRSSSVHLLRPTPDGGLTTAINASPKGNPVPGIHMNHTSPLLKWLKQTDGALPYPDLDLVPQLTGVIREERAELDQIEAELLVPLKSSRGDFLGLLILGKKLSGQPYFIEDNQLVYALTRHLSMVLESARLYDDAVRSRENLEAWLNGMSESVILITREYAIQFMNQAALERFGTNGENSCWRRLGRTDPCSESYCPIKRCTRHQRQLFNYSVSLNNRDYDVAATSQLNPDGTPYVIEVLRDVTERKKAEEREKQLQQEVSLSSRLACIGQLAAGVAHEVNNPLTGIVGYSERLMRKVSDEAVNRDLANIHREALRAARVVQNLLTFAREKKPQKQYADVNEILQQSLELRAYELRTSNIEVELDLALGLPKTVVDPHQLQETFLNIILNAEQAMLDSGGGGKLQITCKQNENHLRISFTDSGPGISAENLDKLFTPFFTTRSDKGGTGLGLSICHGIVTKHGGRIYARSEPGKGAEFVIELPLGGDPE